MHWAGEMSLELLLRPDLGRRPYRLKCRFVVGAFPSERTLEQAKYKAADMFVRDMEKQGWQNVEKHGFKMSGPFPHVETINLPSRSQQQQWHTPSRELIAAVQAGHRPKLPAQNGGYARVVPRLPEIDDWEFELAGVFIHETILTEVPDEHEEKRGRT